MSNNELLSKIYNWMFIGLITTFAISYIISVTPALYNLLYSSVLPIILLVVEVVLIFMFSAMFEKLSKEALTLIFIAYSIMNGIVLTGIFIVYNLNSITLTFLITALFFFILATIGKNTTKDLTSTTTILQALLIVLVVGLVINIFLKNTLADIILTIVGLAVFCGLTITDTNKIINMKDNPNMIDKIVIFGALTLYLDFINIFIRMLKLMGKMFEKD